MTTTRIALAAFALALFAGSASAGEGCGGMDVAGHVFEMSDADGDGILSRAEFTAAGLERYGAPFEDYDADGDGVASLDEYRALYDRYHESGDELET